MAGAVEPCPLCGNVKRNETDVREGYCGRCHWFTFDPVLLAHWCREFPEKVAEAFAFRDRNMQLAP